MRRFAFSPFLLTAGALLAIAGCKAKPVMARTDAQLASDVQAKLLSDKAFSSPDSPDINVAVSKGVATLNGQAVDDNARLRAGNEASQVPGITQVVNDITVPDAQGEAACIPPKPVHRARLHLKARHERAPELASSYAPPAAASEAPMAPAPPVYGAPGYVVPPAPVVVPVRPLYYGYRYHRRYWGRPYPVRPYGYGPRVGVYIHP